MVHYVNRKRLCVQPNFSWYQPDAYGPRDTSNQDPPPEIMRLNDHCMGHIFRYLRLVDRIHFARICVRFRDVYDQMSSSLDKFVDFSEFEDMTLWDVRDFFMLSGKFVKRIEGVVPTRHRQRLFEYLGAHCINLESLNVKATKITSQNMRKMLSKLHQLIELQLDSCDLRNDALIPLKNLVKLKKLDVSNNANLTGDNMHLNLPASIESLILAGCVAMEAKYLGKAFKTLPLLKELNIKGISCIAPCLMDMPEGRILETICITSGLGPFVGVNDFGEFPGLTKLIVHSPMDGRPIHLELIQSLVEFNSKELQYLEIRGKNCIRSPMLIQIAKIEALRTLVLSNCEKINDTDMEVLCSLKNLEELRLKTNYTISDNTLLRIIFACPKLQTLHLLDCPYITNKLINDMIFKLRLHVRQQKFERKLPIKLHVYHTGISSEMQSVPDVAAKDIVDLSLSQPSSSDLCHYNLLGMNNFHLDTDSDDSMDSDFRQYILHEHMGDDYYDFNDDDYDDDDDFDGDYDDDDEEIDYDYADDMVESWD